MQKKNDSLTVVLNGDWNKYYIQPAWIAQHVFELETIEVGINYENDNVEVLFQSNNVVIRPTRSKVVFSALSVEEETIGLFCKCVNNFLQKATTPFLTSFGFNSDFLGDAAIFSELVDSMGENCALIEAEAEIVNTRIEKTIRLGGKVYNLSSSIDSQSKFILHINEHNEGPFEANNYPVISKEVVETFWKNCWKIANALGYEED